MASGIVSSLVIFWPVILITALYTAYVRIVERYRRRRLGSRAVSVPYRIPFGFDLAYRMLIAVVKNNFINLQQSFLEYGHVVEVKAAGSTMIFTDDPNIFKACMATNFSDFGKGKVIHDVFIGSMGESIFCTDGDTWRRSRSILRPHTAKIRPTDLEVTEEHFANLLKHLSNGGKSIEVWDLVDRYQLDVATRIFFGRSADSLVSNRQPFRNAMERLLKVAMLKMTFGELGLFLPEWLIAPGSLKELNRYVKSLYDLAYSSDFQNKNEGDLTLLESLASRGLDFYDFKAQVSAIMLGGKDPPALTMAWAIWEMARHPEVYQRVRSEVASVCGLTTPPTAAQLKECQYIRHVANEAMRLYHPLAINMKIALRDTTLPTGGGLSGKEPLGVLKGTQVVLSLWSLQRRPDLVDSDSNMFNPSRWETWKPKQWEFLPFNHGIRTCIGQKFGQEQVEYVIARIAQEFEELAIPDKWKGKEMKYKIELNIKPLHGCHVRFFSKRDDRRFSKSD